MRKAVIYAYAWACVKVVHSLCEVDLLLYLHPAKFEHAITHQQVNLQQESLYDGTAVRIVSCFNVLIKLIKYRIFIIF